MPGMSHRVRIPSIIQERIQPSHSEVKAGLSRQIHTSQTDCGPSQKVREGPQCMGLSLWKERGPEGWGWLVFMDWVIS